MTVRSSTTRPGLGRRNNTPPTSRNVYRSTKRLTRRKRPMCKKIAEWLLRSVKVNKEEVYEALDKMDADKDGFFSLGEFIKAIRDLVKK